MTANTIRTYLFTASIIFAVGNVALGEVEGEDEVAARIQSTAGTAIANKGAQNLLRPAGAVAEVFPNLFAALERVEGDNLQHKAKNLLTQFQCLRGDSLEEKMRTTRALLEVGKAARQPSNADRQRKLEIVKRYWSQIFRPLGGVDGVFNTGDTNALMGCLAQGEIDWLANQLIVRAAYPIISNEVWSRVPGFRSRIANRVAGNIGSAVEQRIRGMVHNWYATNKWQVRGMLEEKGKALVDKALLDIFKITDCTPYQEPVCENSPWYSYIYIPAAMDFVSEFYGINLLDMAAREMWNRYYCQDSPNQLPALPKSISLPEADAEFRFPKGLPIHDIERVLFEGKLPTMVVGMKEERRTVKGEERTIRIFEVEPQKVVFGANLEQEIYYRKQDGKYVAYPTVHDLFPNSPAQKAGIKIGDYIKSLDGVDMGRVLTPEQEAQYQKGQLGSLGIVTDTLNRIEQQARSFARSLTLGLRVLAPDQTRRDRTFTLVLDHPCTDTGLAAAGISDTEEVLSDEYFTSFDGEEEVDLNYCPVPVEEEREIPLSCSVQSRTDRAPASVSTSRPYYHITVKGAGGVRVRAQFPHALDVRPIDVILKDRSTETRVFELNARRTSIKVSMRNKKNKVVRYHVKLKNVDTGTMRRLGLYRLMPHGIAGGGERFSFWVTPGRYELIFRRVRN